MNFLNPKYLVPSGDQLVPVSLQFCLFQEHIQLPLD